MSRYYQNLTIFITLFFIASGCTAKSSIIQNIFKVSDYELVEKDLQEDRLTIYAIDAYNRRDFESATKYYKKLYDATNKVIYATRAIESASFMKDFQSVGDILTKVTSNKQTSPAIERYLVAYHIDKKEFDKAKVLAKKLYKKDKTIKNSELLALTHEGLQEYDEALKIYNKVYQDNKSSYILLRKFNILYIRLGKKQKAVRLLETHKAMQGCSTEICTKLLQHYAFSKDIEGVERILIKLYKRNKHPLYAKKLIHLYSVNKSYEKAIKFLKDTRYDDLLLLNLYTTKKDYKSALKVARDIYNKEQKPEMLARLAILEYEANRSKMSKEKLKNITDKFEKIIYDLDDPLYYNYYGYLLIDHDLDVDKGMKLVQKALKVEPNSHFYIDSMAWGMYKKGEIKGAYKLLKPVAETDEEQEIQDHFNTIKKAMDK